METKEVTLRQCCWCKEENPVDDMRITYLKGAGIGGIKGEKKQSYECVHCFIDTINQAKKEAGDKTEFVLIEKPRDQRLGQVIMNNERAQWMAEHYEAEAFKRMWERHKEGIKRFIDFDSFLQDYLENNFWTIWEQDTPDIQEKINKLKN